MLIRSSSERAALKKLRKKQSGRFLSLRCHQGVCLVYSGTIVDRNGDGVSDADTVAMGLNSKNASLEITGPQVIAALGAGRLDSFNRGQSAVVVIPETLPNKERLVSRDAASLRSHYLSAAGISKETLANKLPGSSGFFLVVDRSLEKGPSKSPMPSVRIGAVEAGQISHGSADELARAVAKARGAAVSQGASTSSVEKYNKNDRGQGESRPKQPQKDGGTRTLDEYGPGAISLSAEEVARVLYQVRGGEVSGDQGEGTKQKHEDNLKNPDKVDPPPKDPPPKDPKDGGSYTTGEYGGDVIKLSPREIAVIAAIRGGDPVRGVSGGAVDNGPVVGTASGRWIVLVDPEQEGAPIDERFSFLVGPPEFVDKSPKNTSIGEAIIDGVVFGSGRPNPKNEGTGAGRRRPRP